MTFAGCIALVELPAGLYPATEGDVSYNISISVNCHCVDICRVHDAGGTACRPLPPLSVSLKGTSATVSLYP